MGGVTSLYAETYTHVLPTIPVVQSFLQQPVCCSTMHQGSRGMSRCSECGKAWDEPSCQKHLVCLSVEQATASACGVIP